jgi:hypothetical protein
LKIEMDLTHQSHHMKAVINSVSNVEYRIPGNSQAIAQSDFFGLSIQSKSITKIWLTIQIQMQFSKWIDNPIQIQSQSNNFWKILWWNHGIPKIHFLSTFKLIAKLFVWKFWWKLAWLYCWSMIHYKIWINW